MNLSPDICYRAIKSRDARFDGRFFTGVTTTGIYCRPVCPATTPKRKNVRFFACAAAAEAEGFRPCLRCRPETAPGTPAWIGTTATVSRARKLIDEGYLDTHTIDELADLLGVGARHLRRLFLEELGAPPNAIAHSRRVAIARQLVDDTALTMTAIADVAGFNSIRRFNAAMRASFGASPREIRARRNGSHTRAKDQPLTLRLSYREPFAWDELIAFFGRRAIPGVEEVDADTYRRSAVCGDASGLITVRTNPERRLLTVEIPAQLAACAAHVVKQVRRVFDLDADPRAIAEHLRQDALLAASVTPASGLRVPGGWDPFEIGVRAILGQQISVAAARTLLGRLSERFGKPVDASGAVTRVFPGPRELATARVEQIGLPVKRADAIRALARAELDRAVFHEPYADLDALIQRLCKLQGIGPWSAHYIAMRAYGEPDAFPAGDLGVRKAIGPAGQPVSEAAARERAEAWRPWRAYAAMHLWKTGAAADAAPTPARRAS